MLRRQTQEARPLAWLNVEEKLNPAQKEQKDPPAATLEIHHQNMPCNGSTLLRRGLRLRPRKVTPSSLFAVRTWLIIKVNSDLRRHRVKQNLSHGNRFIEQ